MYLYKIYELITEALMVMVEQVKDLFHVGVCFSESIDNTYTRFGKRKRPRL